MSNEKGIGLLVFTFDLNTLSVIDIANESSEIDILVEPVNSTIDTLFNLRKRDVSFLRESGENTIILSTSAKNEYETPCLLSIKKEFSDMTAVCTVVPREDSERKFLIAEELLNNIESGFYEPFGSLLPSPLLIIDFESRMQVANKDMFKLFDLNETDIRGINFGNVFRCSAADETRQRCGTFSHCLNCNLRNGITEILEGRLELLEAETDFEYVTNKGYDVMHIKITAAKMEFRGMSFIAVSFIQL